MVGTGRGKGGHGRLFLPLGVGEAAGRAVEEEEGGFVAGNACLGGPGRNSSNSSLPYKDFQLQQMNMFSGKRLYMVTLPTSTHSSAVGAPAAPCAEASNSSVEGSRANRETPPAPGAAAKPHHGTACRLRNEWDCRLKLYASTFSGSTQQHGDLRAIRTTLVSITSRSVIALNYISFQGLGQLQSLDLSNNSLSVLRNDTLAQFRGLPALRRISLSHNTWVCDCAIEDLVAWLKESDQVEGKEALTCSYPDKMLGKALLKINSLDLNCSVPIDLPSQLQTSYVFLGIVLALIGAIFLLVLYLNRKGIKKWMHNIRDACRDHMEGYHYRYEINADPRLTNLSSNSDV
ncbi:PREDICTED: trophoblast glycoprotein [Chaetura pelagica]|uniref:trophoblast glycoprotein n=1 Tax=Chaetura pelagica TaxID=8897 RepID=UPI000523B4AF|nr:PREDICTED: trophoblast glycoprotein [Chaetura pelagica]